MCGFAGIYYFNGQEVDPGNILEMTAIIKHRGPDDSGIRYFSLSNGSTWEEGKEASRFRREGAIGFNRLSILDTSDKGHQPMVSDDGKVILAFNGEIYNAFDYRKKLIEDGEKFRSRTDTEVILKLYQRMGLEETLEKLNGMLLCQGDLAPG